MKSLYALSIEEQKKMALETMEIYAPLAYQLGMHKLSGELDDLAFPYIYAHEYNWLLAKTKEYYGERERFAKSLAPVIESQLRSHAVDFVRLDYRAKRYASLYKKLLRLEDQNPNDIGDLVAFRIITKTVSDCYSVLGIVHSLWQPIPGRFWDFIGTPKSNGYQSLHTTVKTPENQLMEFQIRTEGMHEYAEFGVAAHFAYHFAKNVPALTAERLGIRADLKEAAIIRQLQEWREHVGGSPEFLESLKIDLFKDRVLVLTPKGDVIDLPKGSTPLDFAYKIHTQVGNRSAGAKVNGKMVALDYALHSGDTVEILTHKSRHPTPSWLSSTRTNSARAHIRAALRAMTGVFNSKSDRFIEIQITAKKTEGLLDDIVSVFSQARLKVEELVNERQTWLPRGALIKVKTSRIPEDRLRRLVGELERLDGVSKVSTIDRPIA